MRDDSDDRGREDDEPEREKDDRPEVRFELADGGEIPSREKDGRQEDEEHGLGRKLEGRQAGKKAEKETAEDHDDRIRNGEPPCDDGERGDDHEQEENEL